MRVRVSVKGVNGISLEGRSVIVAMCVGQLGSLLPHVVVPSILAAFLIPEWHLSGAQAGLLAGSGAAGYMRTVPVRATLTDRIDARKILIAGSAVSALGTLLFGMFATGLWSGALFNAIAGVGFAGAYMPGLKALTDRLAPGDSSRAITLYASSFSLGVGLSFLVSQLVAEAWGWRSAFFVTAAGPLVMLTVCLLLRPVEPRQAAQEALGIGMGGGMQLGGLADLDHPAGIHDGDAVAERRHQLQVVADENQPHAALGHQIVEDRQHLQLDGDVERGCRLVGDH